MYGCISSEFWGLHTYSPNKAKCLWCDISSYVWLLNPDRHPQLWLLLLFIFLPLPETDLPFQKEKQNGTSNQPSGKFLPAKHFKMFARIRSELRQEFLCKNCPPALPSHGFTMVRGGSFPGHQCWAVLLSLHSLGNLSCSLRLSQRLQV